MSANSAKYLSLTVRTYLSGMMTRLNFVLVISVVPGVLLTEEGIATGDPRFAERVSQRVREVKGPIGRGRLVVLASRVDETIHSMGNKAALMSVGQILSVESSRQV